MNEIATPIAGERLERKLYRMAKRVYRYKGVRRGVKEVCKAIRKGKRGIVLLAADITPIDVISHLPILCEKNSLPYIFVKERHALGTSCLTSRPTSAVMLVEPPIDDDLKDSFD